jgi:hypothetical protein
MTEEAEGLGKVQDSDLEPGDFLLARDLIRYYRHSFDVRCAGMLDVEIDPPEVRELINFLQWCGGGYDILDLGRHVLTLSEIVSTSASEMQRMVEYIRANGADRHAIAELQFVQAQMEAADTLMGYLTDG